MDDRSISSGGRDLALKVWLLDLVVRTEKGLARNSNPITAARHGDPLIADPDAGWPSRTFTAIPNWLPPTFTWPKGSVTPRTSAAEGPSGSDPSRRSSVGRLRGDRRPSARAGWARCTGRGIRGSAATSRSRSCRRISPRIAGRLKRFEKEARSASALNHPNIVTIYDIGSADAVSYIAMELVEGKTLRELLFAGAASDQSASCSSPLRSPTVWPAHTRPASSTGT